MKKYTTPKKVKKYPDGGTNYDKLAAAILGQLKIQGTGSLSPVEEKNRDIQYDETDKMKPIQFYDFDRDTKRQFRKNNVQVSQIRQLEDSKDGRQTFQYDETREIGKVDNPIFSLLNPLADATAFTANSINDMKQRKQERKKYYLDSREGSYNQNEFGLNNIPMYKKGGKNKQTPVEKNPAEDFYYYTRDPKAQPANTWQYEVGKREDASAGSLGEQLRDKYTDEDGSTRFATARFEGTPYEQDNVRYNPVDKQGQSKYNLIDRNVNFYNADKTIQDFIAAQAARNMQASDPNKQYSVVGEQVNDGSGYVDVSPYNIDQQFRLWNYEDNPNYRPINTNVVMPDLTRHLRVPTLTPIPRGTTPRPKRPRPTPTPRPIMPSDLKQPVVQTRDNTMTQANGIRAANGQLLPIAVQERLAADANAKSQKYGTANIFDEDGNLVGVRDANWYNGQYSEDRLNYGELDVTPMGPVEEIIPELVLFAAAGPLGNAAARLGRLAKLGLNSRRAKEILPYIQKQIAEGKNVQKLLKDKELIKLLKSSNSKKLLQDKPAFSPTGLSGKWSPVKGPYKEGGENAYSIGDSLDLTPDQIADLIRKGYDFEIE